LNAVVVIRRHTYRYCAGVGGGGGGQVCTLHNRDRIRTSLGIGHNKTGNTSYKIYVYIKLLPLILYYHHRYHNNRFSWYRTLWSRRRLSLNYYCIDNTSLEKYNNAVCVHYIIILGYYQQETGGAKEFFKIIFFQIYNNNIIAAAAMYHE